MRGTTCRTGHRNSPNPSRASSNLSRLAVNVITPNQSAVSFEILLQWPVEDEQGKSSTRQKTMTCAGGRCRGCVRAAGQSAVRTYSSLQLHDAAGAL